MKNEDVAWRSIDGVRKWQKLNQNRVSECHKTAYEAHGYDVISMSKIGRNLANEINATDRDVTGPTEQVQIMFPLKDKNIN